MEILDLRVEDLAKGVQSLKEKGFDQVFERFNKSLPAMKCNRCGNCCDVPPRTTYAEFLYTLLRLMQTVSRDQLAQILRECVKLFFVEMLGDAKCPLYSEDGKGCSVYSAAPVSCRSFGLDRYHELSVVMDHAQNVQMNAHYAKHGLVIKEEIAFRRTDCSKVNIVGTDITAFNMMVDTFIMSTLYPMNLVLSGPDEEVPFFMWMALVLLEGRMTMEFKVHVARTVQSGSTETLEMVLAAIDFYRFADRLLESVRAAA